MERVPLNGATPLGFGRTRMILTAEPVNLASGKIHYLLISYLFISLVAWSAPYSQVVYKVYGSSAITLYESRFAICALLRTTVRTPGGTEGPSVPS